MRYDTLYDESGSFVDVPPRAPIRSRKKIFFRKMNGGKNKGSPWLLLPPARNIGETMGQRNLI
jgi:hypothetical protein